MRVDLFDPVDIILLTWTGLRIVAVHIAEDTVADADIFVGVDAQSGEDGFTFFRFEDLFGTVDPARAQPFGVSGVEQIAHDERAIFLPGHGGGAVGQDHEHHGSAIEGVVVGTHHGGVEAAHLIAHLTVGDGDDDRCLAVHARRSVGARLADLFDDLLGRNLVGVAADATTRQQVLHGRIHSRFVCSFLIALVIGTLRGLVAA